MTDNELFAMDVDIMFELLGKLPCTNEERERIQHEADRDTFY